MPDAGFYDRVVRREPAERITVDQITILLLSVMSFLAGFIDSIAGGGGLVLLPSLLITGLAPPFALGTNKFASLCGTATALLNFVRNGKVIWKIAAFGLPFSIAGSVLGTKTILYFDQDTMARILLFLLPFSALVTFMPRKELKTTGSDFSKINMYFHIPLFCLAIGFYDGFFGPGTGTFLIFGFYAFLGIHLLNASAIAKVFNLASNVGSFFTFALDGKVLFELGLPIAVANILGGYLGSVLAIKRGQALIKVLLLVVFGILFVTLAWRIWNG